MKLTIILKDYVKILSKSESITFSDQNYSLTFNSQDPILMKAKWSIDLSEESQLENILNLKIASELISMGWISVQISPGEIYLDYVSDLSGFFGSSSASDKSIFNQDILAKQDGSQVILLNHLNKSVIRISLTLFISCLENKLSLTERDILHRIGVLSSEHPLDGLVDIMARGFNNLQINQSTEMVDLNHHLSPALFPESNLVLRDLNFNRLLKDRKSAKKQISGVPKISELEEYLIHVCGTKRKWNYSSSGGLYSTQLIVEIPGQAIYRFNSAKGELTIFSEAKSHAGEYIKIFLVTDQNRLKKKYKNFYYRLSLLDSGVILHQLSLVTSLFGWQGRPMGWTNEQALRRIYPALLNQDDMITGEFHVALN